MTRDMLELCKKVLLRVSSNRALFARELKKSIKQLTGDELKVLKAWCTNQFQHIYADLIEASFRQFAVM